MFARIFKMQGTGKIILEDKNGDLSVLPPEWAEE